MRRAFSHKNNIFLLAFSSGRGSPLRSLVGVGVRVQKVSAPPTDEVLSMSIKSSQNNKNAHPTPPPHSVISTKHSALNTKYALCRYPLALCHLKTFATGKNFIA